MGQVGTYHAFNHEMRRITSSKRIVLRREHTLPTVLHKASHGLVSASLASSVLLLTALFLPHLSSFPQGLAHALLSAGTLLPIFPLANFSSPLRSHLKIPRLVHLRISFFL